jgi:hypothetical protein
MEGAASNNILGRQKIRIWHNRLDIISVEPKITKALNKVHQCIKRCIRRFLTKNSLWIRRNQKQYLASFLKTIGFRKHFHSISPTGKIAHHNDPSQPTGCPCCDCPIKSEARMILCPAPINRQWRSTFVDRLQKFFDSPSMDTNPYLSDILCHGVLLWFNQEQYDPVSAPPRSRLLVQEHNAIGWHQLLHGSLSKEWSRHHDIHLAQKGQPDIKKSGDQLSRSVIHYFVQQ